MQGIARLNLVLSFLSFPFLPFRSFPFLGEEVMQEVARLNRTAESMNSGAESQGMARLVSSTGGGLRDW